MRQKTRHRTRKKHTRRTKTKSSHSASKRRKQGKKYGGTSTHVKDLRVVQASNRWVIHRKISPRHGKGQRGGEWTRHLGRIGEGNFGSVYECSKEGQGGDGKRYAMKVFDSRGKTDRVKERMNENMKKEIAFTQDIYKLATDPAYTELDVKAVEIIDYKVSLQDEESFYVQTLVPGGNMEKTLTRYIGDHLHGNETHWKPVFVDIARYIYMCNKHGIFHNDIKLENVMLDESNPPRAYVIDLGFATHDITIDGTPNYMPPDETHPRDIWAFGILVSQMLLGKFYRRKIDLVLVTWRSLIKRSRHITPDLKRLLRYILHPEIDKRLTDLEVFRSHPWFESRIPEIELIPIPPVFEPEPPPEITMPPG